MQLILIVGIIFAIGAVGFALQNNLPVTVAFALWSFQGSLAVVLLLALGFGALIAGLLSSPAMIRRQWHIVRLRHRISDLERKLAEREKQNDALSAELVRLSPPDSGGEVDEKPYVGLRTLLTGGATADQAER